MKLLFLVISLLGSAVAGPTIENYIVDGHTGDIYNFNYMASLQLNGEHICGAVAISRWFMLTAAQCTYGQAPSSLKLRYDSNYWASGGILADVLEVIEHNQFDVQTLNFDFALLKIDTLPSYISPIKLPALNEELPPGYGGTILGWGALYDGGPLSVDLQATKVPIIDRNECQIFYNSLPNPPNEIYPQMFCVGFDGQRDACTGDEGGAFVFNDVLHGIISWGFKCGDQIHPGVYAMVSTVRDWIELTAGV